MFARFAPFLSVLLSLALCFPAADISAAGTDSVKSANAASKRRSPEKSASDKTRKRHTKSTQESSVGDINNSLNMRLVKIPAGSFVMGSPLGEDGRESSETQHEVRITRPFYMATAEVTQAQWKRLMKSEPSDSRACGPDCPVERVSWFDAVEFCNALSRAEKLTICYQRRGKLVRRVACTGYRLPTEAEWEYAARAGSTSAVYSGPVKIKGVSNAPDLNAVAWYSGNSDTDFEGAADCSGWFERPQPGVRCGPHPVAGKRPNAWGLYDMLGNAGEWVQDWYGPYDARAAVDPHGPTHGDERVWRGGSWVSLARYNRAATRLYYDPNETMHEVGFRVVRETQK